MDVPAATVYAAIADYQQHHARFLPPAFSDLVVEEGGVGAGTIVRFQLKVGGRARTVRARIDEPEPGRVLTETEIGRRTVTSFTVTPAGARSRVRIATRWDPVDGLAGWMERLLAPRMLGRVYADELERLEAYARSIAR